MKTLIGAIVLALAGAGAASADQPVPGGLGLQPPATFVAEQGHAFHNLLLPIIFGIAIFVLALLVWVAIRYNAKANPVPKKFSHNVLVEVVWTVVPVLILIVIAVPSFRLLYLESRIPQNVDMTINVTGYQWYWGYEYPDHGGILLESRMLEDAEAAAAGKPRLLGTDNPLVVPVGATVRAVVTANDVIHAWSIPAFFVLTDAIPGRANETWFKAERTGTFYGQCREICGIDHAHMPIEVKVVTPEEFQAWVARTQAEQGIAAVEPTPATPVPAAAPVTPADAAPAATVTPTSARPAATATAETAL